MNRQKRPMSSLEQVVADMLDDLKIEWEREVPLKYLQGYRYYDFRLIGYNVMIEVDGSYWHGDRDKPSYVTLMAKKNDMIKSWLAKKEGYELIRIKEKQLKEEYNTVVENISLAVEGLEAFETDLRAETFHNSFSMRSFRRASSWYFLGDRVAVSARTKSPRRPQIIRRSSVVAIQEAVSPNTPPRQIGLPVLKSRQ